MNQSLVNQNVFTETCKPWVEKHRPKQTTNIVQQSNLKKIIDAAQIHSNMPHLLLYGPPGCGKTTTAFSIRRQYYYSKERNISENKQIYVERVLELNASDERGIQIVKGKIKTFAEKKIIIRKGIPNFKLIILDECDAMTSDSQLALRRTMEDYSIDTRFIMICNNHNQIIVPVRSRALMIRYKHIDIDHMKIVIKNIAEKENITVSTIYLNRLHSITNGDLRKAINLLEQCDLMYGEHTLTSLNECAGMIDENFFNNIIETLVNPNINIHEDLIKLTKDFINESYSVPALLYDLFNFINNSKKCNEVQVKMNLIDVMSSVDASINIKTNESIILLYLFTSFHYYLAMNIQK